MLVKLNRASWFTGVGFGFMNSTVDGAYSRSRLDEHLFYAGRFIRDAARWMMAVLAVIFLAYIGLSSAEIGIIFGFSLAGGFVISVAVMLTSHRIPLRTWAMAQMGITAIAGVVLIYSTDFWILIVGGFFGSYAASGAHWGAMTPIEQTGLAAVVDSERRTRAFSNLTIASAGGRAIGALLAGTSTLLIESFGWQDLHAYQATLWVYVLMLAMATLIYAFLSRAVHLPSEAIPDGDSNPRDRSVFVNPFKAKARKSIVGLSGFFALDSFAGGMVFESFLSFWLFTKFGMSAAEIGGVLIASQALNIVSLALAPWVARKIGLLNTLVSTQVASNVMLIAFAFSPTLVVAVGLWLVRSLFDEMDVPTRQAYMLGITEPSEHPIMAGSANIGRGIGRIPSASITGFLWAGGVTMVPWLLAGGLKLTYNAAIWWTFRRVKV